MDILPVILIILAKSLAIVVKVLYILILIRVILSWINPSSMSQAADLIYKVTEPVLRPLRVVLHLGLGGLDLSPLIAMLILFLIEKHVINWLFILSSRL